MFAYWARICHSWLVRALGARGPDLDSRISHDPCFDFLAWLILYACFDREVETKYVTCISFVTKLSLCNPFKILHLLKSFPTPSPKACPESRFCAWPLFLFPEFIFTLHLTIWNLMANFDRMLILSIITSWAKHLHDKSRISITVIKHKALSLLEKCQNQNDCNLGIRKEGWFS